MKAKLLITGGSGQIGGAVARLAAAHGFAASAPGRDRLDLTRADDIAAAVASEEWAAIINCAAYTAVDKAQSEPELANQINRVAAGIFASEAARHGIPLVHLSTDYVFDGSKAGPYVEDDPVNPLGVYGASKEAGEAAVRAANPAHAILRTAWVVSASGANFINTMLRLAQTKDEISVVNDQHGCPSSADDIAEAVLLVAARLIDGSVTPGTWHFVNSGSATWYDLACHVFAAASAAGRKVPLVRPIPTTHYPTPARRPANSQLDTSRFTADFGLIPCSWQEAVSAIMAERLQRAEEKG